MSKTSEIQNTSKTHIQKNNLQKHESAISVTPNEMNISSMKKEEFPVVVSFSFARRDISEVINSDQLNENSLIKAKKLIAAGKNLTAIKKYLNQAISLEPDNNDVNMMLIDLNEIDEADLLYEKGREAFSRNDFVNAYALIVQALEVRPDHKNWVIKKNKIEKKLVQYYYKQALMAQRKHELNMAIRHWDALLLIDNTNDNAKLYRVKAVSLKSKLDKFVSKK